MIAKKYNMKYITSLLSWCFCTHSLFAQDNIYPAPAQQGAMAIVNATLHTGTGQVISNANLVFENGKIVSAGVTPVAANIKTWDAAGKHVYPGLIAACTNLGLVEVPTVKASVDFSELGEMNPNLQALYAYNTESKIINTLRSNGILMAGITPMGGTISGSSSVVQLDAWNWEDAALRTGNGIHVNIPLLTPRPNAFRRNASTPEEQVKQGLERVEAIRIFFREAKAYLAATPAVVNLKYEAVKGLFNGTQRLFAHCDLVREMMIAVDLATEFNMKLVIVGGTDSWMIAGLLKKTNTAVVLSKPHESPLADDDDVDQPYKTAAALKQAGVLFALCDTDGQGYWRQRNLPFYAGTLAAYGLDKEEALAAITLSAAKILDIDDRTGSLEAGKDASFIICEGDLLDMRSSRIVQAFIQGRQINLDNKHNQLFEKYKYKYGIK
jgi:imidazolonepropionase-like amidohydrolase